MFNTLLACSRPALFLIALATLCGCSGNNPFWDNRPRVIYLNTMGQIPSVYAKRAAIEIEKFYGIKVEYQGRAQLPGKKCSVRNRYRAADILQVLTAANEANSNALNDKILALTDQDIETEDKNDQGQIKRHWGVMGLGKVGGDESVVSTFRLHGSRDRFTKVTLHEVGHMLNMDHCRSNLPACFMNDAKGKASVVDSARIYLCNGCKKSQKFS